PVGACFVTILPLDLLPVHQFNRRGHNAHKARSLHRLEALAAARGHVILVPAEFHRPAAAGLQHQLVEAAAHQRAANAGVAFLQLDAHDTLADAGQDIYIVDLEVDDVTVGAGQVDRLLFARQPNSHNLVAVVEPDI